MIGIVFAVLGSAIAVLVGILAWVGHAVFAMVGLIRRGLD